MAKNINIDFGKLKNLKNLPKPARIIIAVAPALLFTAIFLYFGILPKNKQIDVLDQEISEQENVIAKKQSMAARLDTLIKENKKLKNSLKELEEHLPEEKEISNLLKQVSDLGREAGLQILSWRPATRRQHKSGIVYEVPVSVSLTGSYHRLGRFFSSLTNLERIVNILNINLSSPQPKGTEAILSVSFSAVTFTAISEGGLAK